MNLSGGEAQVGIIKPRRETELFKHFFKHLRTYSFRKKLVPSKRADGVNPYAELISVDEVLYGKTGSGGTANSGTIFYLEP